MRTVFAIVLLVLLTGRSLGEDVKERMGAIPRMEEELKKVKEEYTNLIAKVEKLILQREEDRATITQMQTQAEKDRTTITKLQTQAEDDRATVTQLQNQVDTLRRSTDLSATCHLNNDQLQAFNGRSVSDFPLTTQEGLEKPWMCAWMCSEDNRCRSYRYNSETGVCATYAVGYSTLQNTFNTVSVETGSKLYLMCGKKHAFGTACTSTADCHFTSSSCKAGSCECSLGYSYDPNTGGCVTQCSRFGDFFVKYQDHGVLGCNTRIVYTSADGCMQACRDEPSIVCVNAEYSRSAGKCNMCHVTWYGLSYSARNTADYGWDLYYRHCAL